MPRGKYIVVGNWKMNPGTLAEARKNASCVRVTARRTRWVETIICPPFVYLSALSPHGAPRRLFWGAQDCFFEREGSFTGEISPEMLSGLGVSHVIVGHSERRRRGETNRMVNRKMNAALAAGLTPIFCVGEGERDPEGMYLGFLKGQLLEGLKQLSRKALSSIVIAYEPIFAIGKSSSDALTPTDVHEMSLYIRKVLKDILTQTGAQSVPILYGGSVAPENAGKIVAGGGVQGLLVGHQSLDPKKFSEIIRVVDAVA